MLARAVRKLIPAIRCDPVPYMDGCWRRSYHSLAELAFHRASSQGRAKSNSSNRNVGGREKYIH